MTFGPNVRCASNVFAKLARLNALFKEWSYRNNLCPSWCNWVWFAHLDFITPISVCLSHQTDIWICIWLHVDGLALISLGPVILGLQHFLQRICASIVSHLLLRCLYYVILSTLRARQSRLSPECPRTTATTHDCLVRVECATPLFWSHSSFTILAFE